MSPFDSRRPTLLAVAFLLALSAGAFVPSVSAQQTTPGTSAAVPSADSQAAARAVVRPLNPVINETGQISTSIDGVGTNNGAGGTVDVDKPAGATVRSAFLFSATVPGNTFGSSDVILAGLTVADGDWDEKVSNDSPRGFVWENARKDVTSTIKPIIDAAAAGITSIAYDESSTFQVDGSVLLVIFDDPAVTETRTVVITFGGQTTDGDDFNITLSSPFDGSTQSIRMSLGISFGFQLSGGNQRSLIDVNGNRLTSSAGGEDDGMSQDGALLTVGGIGDDPANPADPTAGPSNPRTDDELYTLDPFIDDGDTQILVSTSNPSNDDNIFLAVFDIRGSAAIVGEGILLTPIAAENPVGTDHTVTARVQDDDGDPVSGREVRFEVLSGPNGGQTFTAATSGAGLAGFTFSSDIAGTDVVVARFDDSGGVERTSNQATKVWTDDMATPGCTPAAEVFFSGFETSPASPPADPRGEYAEVSNDAGDGTAYDLSGCDFVVFDPFTEDVIYAADIADMTLLGDGGSYEFANVVVGNGQPIPAGTFPDAPSAFALIDGDASVGMSVGAVLASAEVVAAVVVDRDGTVFGSARGGASSSAASNAQGLYEALSRLYATADEDEAGEADLSVTAAPNPISGAGAVSFGLAEPGAATVELYDALGRRVALVAQGTYGRGRHDVGLSVSGLPAGLYVVRVLAEGTARTARLMVVR